jgi:hypothetical protein
MLLEKPGQASSHQLSLSIVFSMFLLKSGTEQRRNTKISLSKPLPSFGIAIMLKTNMHSLSE